ncbi:MAG: nitroreductase family protein [Christensenellales bacterium]|jgi:FMN reductase [NAD(P)H]
MEVSTAIRQRRSIRRFQQHSVETYQLMELINLARFHTSVANRQPIRYAVIAGEKRDVVFSELRWATYLPDFKILSEQQPEAYILIMADQEAGKYGMFEAGAAATNLMLAAEEMGLSTCCLGVPNQKKLSRALELPQKQEIIVVIAIGYAACHSRTVPYEGDVRYFVDENGDFYVPKIDMKDLVLYIDLPKESKS